MKTRNTFISQLRRDSRFTTTSHTIRKTYYEVYNRKLTFTEAGAVIRRFDLHEDYKRENMTMVIQFKQTPTTKTYKLQIFTEGKNRRLNDFIVEERSVMEARSIVEGVLCKEGRWAKR